MPTGQLVRGLGVGRRQTGWLAGCWNRWILGRRTCWQDAGIDGIEQSVIGNGKPPASLVVYLVGLLERMVQICRGVLKHNAER